MNVRCARVNIGIDIGCKTLIYLNIGNINHVLIKHTDIDAQENENFKYFTCLVSGQDAKYGENLSKSPLAPISTSADWHQKLDAKNLTPILTLFGDNCGTNN